MHKSIPSARWVAYHILTWAILFAGWYYFRVKDFPNASVALVITAVKIATLAVLVYLTNYWLIPKFLYAKKYLLFGCCYLLIIFTIGSLKIYVNEHLLAPYFNGTAIFSDLRERIYDNIIPLFLLTSTAATVKLLVDYVQSERRISEITREKSETELKFLKSQINPHFLFNSLNAVYFLIDKQNTDARQTLLQFSDLLRYQLYDCNAETVDIEKEVSYLKDYLYLQQLRKDAQYEVNMVTENTSGFHIVPLLLIPFIENAFKHISHFSGNKNFVHVRLCRKENLFQFRVENSRDQTEISTEPQGGIGLANVKRRLELLYPGKHRLEIQEENSTFKVALELDIS